MSNSVPSSAAPSIASRSPPNIPEQFEGPFRNTFGGTLEGVDVALAVVIVLAAALYVLFELLFPEPREVYGPGGWRLFRAAEGRPPPPIEAKRAG